MRKSFYLGLFLLLFIPLVTVAQNYNACVKSSPIHIVVLGSSTAAGSGPSSIDSAWVNRYRRHIQSINPNNQVTNLAVGGTTTYHIMPDWFSDSTKPTRNTTKNISEAIRLSADAVIINMPSNDAANGFIAAEQLSNFRTIKNVADSFNVKVWVCTTQPRNFSNAKKLIQLEVRDSILAEYGAFAIDFWTGMADSINGINNIYNSGDGVHVNGLAHRELNNRVINKLIPNHLSDTLNYLDFTIQLSINEQLCGDTADLIMAIVSNLGPTYLASLSIKTAITSPTQTTLISSPTTGGLNSCATDTVLFSINTSAGGKFQVHSFIDASDTIPTNDTTMQFHMNRIGIPSIFSTDTSYCPNDSAKLWASAINQQHIVWYDSLHSSIPIHFGQSYSFLPSNSKNDLYVEAVSGPLHFKESFDLTRNTTTNYNGQMFDIIANDTIILDSLEVPINTLGNQKVVAYYRYGSHKKSENIVGNWTYWGVDSAVITTVGELAVFNFSAKQLTPNDTFSIYIHMLNPTSRLSYQNSSASIFTNPRLTVPSGSGITNTFGTIYYPRNFSGKLHYHYGFNPKGDCQSQRIKVTAFQSLPYLDLGNDTTILATDSLFLSSIGFSQPRWSNGDSTTQLLISNTTFGIGTHAIYLSALDSLGCLNSDTITVTITGSTGLNINSLDAINISPNPTNGIVKIRGGIKTSSTIWISNHLGVKVFESSTSFDVIDLSRFPKGIYYLSIFDEEKKVTKKIILQ